MKPRIRISLREVFLVITLLAVESHGRPASMEVSIPPLSVVMFKPRR